MDGLMWFLDVFKIAGGVALGLSVYVRELKPLLIRPRRRKRRRPAPTPMPT